MYKWLGWWIVCLLGGALFLIIGLVAAIFFIKGMFWIMDNWAGIFFITLFLVLSVAVGAVFHHKGEEYDI